MATPRAHGLSTRVSDEVHATLCQHASIQKVTVSTLVARIVTDAVGGNAAVPIPAATSPPDNLAFLPARLFALEQWVGLLRCFLLAEHAERWGSMEDVECPCCAATTLEAVDGPPDAAGEILVDGYRCGTCGWEVLFDTPAADQDLGH